MFQTIAITLFPEMFPGPLGHSLAGKALEKGLWSLETLQIRDFAADKHQTVDDKPYGGGGGMVMRPDVLDAAIGMAKATLPSARLIHFTPRGEPITQSLVAQLARESLILLCGRFEGIDERVLKAHRPLELSLGDFVLSGGEIAALALLDACVRLLPGVVGKEASTVQDSFAANSDFAGLLEYPHYTRPPLWQGRPVPETLLSGNHQEINAWRLEQAKQETKRRRPDVWARYQARTKEKDT